MLKDDFKLLRLKETATKREVKQAYRELAGKYHPDAGGSVEKFTELNQAYRRCLEAAPEKLSCPDCNGKGRITHQRGFVTSTTQCLHCHGTGKL